MKKLLIAFLIALLPNLCLAADVTLKWDPVIGAKGYKVYKWEVVPDPNTGEHPPPTWVECANTTSEESVQVTVTGLPDTVMILFKVSALGEGTESVKDYAGAWYNGLWRPVESPSGLSSSN